MVVAALLTLWTFFLNAVVEGFIILIVEFFVKVFIKNASSEEERNAVWLVECIILLLIGLTLYITSHIPIIIIFMAVTTFCFTQINRQGSWCYQLLSRWDEFKQHEQSIQEFEKRKLIQQVPVHGPAPLRNIPLSTDPPGYQHFHISARKPLRPDAGHLPLNRMQFRQFTQPGQYPYSSGVLNQVGQPKPVLKMDTSPPPPPKIVLRETASLTSKFRSALGIGSHIPSGMKNNGQNLCFLNAIVQCLSHSPYLTPVLIKADERSDCSVAESDLVKATKDLFKQLGKVSDIRLFNTVDSGTFRAAAGLLVPHMITSPHSAILVQQQQDAAEMLMWLLHTMHDAMNQKQLHNNNLNSVIEMNNLAPLSYLTRLYGDLTISKLQELEKRHLSEIEMSSSMDASGHAESVHRLADLKWLLHKMHNNSIWDDTFSGQLVECQHCLACSRLSVGIQPFTLLHVPIVEPREVTGLVYLEDCFSKFITTENLYGPDGLCCPCVNKRTNSNSTPMRTHTTGSHADSALHSPSTNQSSQNVFMSPIPNIGTSGLNDSGFGVDHRTSTPIAERQNLTHGQRRTLLRQLPKCLIIQLMRFRYNAHYPDDYKIHTPVHIPVRSLSLSSMIFDTNVNAAAELESKYTYDLYAMCLHLGTSRTNFGHYVAYCQSESGTWWKYDDEDVTQINVDFEMNSRLVRENSYLLFYKRRE